MICSRCKTNQAEIEIIRHHAVFCRDCFLSFFRNQVQKAIKKWDMFQDDDKILIAVSGGKDSLSLWSVLLELGYDVHGLFIDLGIDGFSEGARKKVEAFADLHNANLRVIDLKAEGVAVPDARRVLRRNPCSLCGQIKRYFFNLAAQKGGFDVLVTGHNLDDETSRLFANVLHWKVEYLKDQFPVLPKDGVFKKKAKPFCLLSEFEIAAYAFFKHIDYYQARCPLGREAIFALYKQELNRLERESHGVKIEFYQGFLKRIKPLLDNAYNKENADVVFCIRCGYPAAKNGLCFVCNLKDKIDLKK